jgi:curved DNA-binding protein CbpA
MEASSFTDYYEVLEVSPNANSETIERILRYFAQRYHPDNRETGDRHRFDLVVEAHGTLTDPVKRAQYDIQHKNHSDFRWKLAKEASDSDTIEVGVHVRNRLLSMLYFKRLHNIKEPGIGNVELERLLGCPAEHLDFHLWYLKGKAWIERTEAGTVAITVEGVDRVDSDYLSKNNNNFLTDQRRRE